MSEVSQSVQPFAPTTGLTNRPTNNYYYQNQRATSLPQPSSTSSQSSQPPYILNKTACSAGQPNADLTEYAWGLFCLSFSMYPSRSIFHLLVSIQFYCMLLIPSYISCMNGISYLHVLLCHMHDFFSMINITFFILKFLYMYLKIMLRFKTLHDSCGY